MITSYPRIERHECSKSNIFILYHSPLQKFEDWFPSWCKEKKLLSWWSYYDDFARQFARDVNGWELAGKTSWPGKAVILRQGTNQSAGYWKRKSAGWSKVYDTEHKVCSVTEFSSFDERSPLTFEVGFWALESYPFLQNDNSMRNLATSPVIYSGRLCPSSARLH